MTFCKLASTYKDFFFCAENSDENPIRLRVAQWCCRALQCVAVCLMNGDKDKDKESLASSRPDTHQVVYIRIYMNICVHTYIYKYIFVCIRIYIYL